MSQHSGASLRISVKDHLLNRSLNSQRFLEAEQQ